MCDVRCSAGRPSAFPPGGYTRATPIARVSAARRPRDLGVGSIEGHVGSNLGSDASQTGLKRWKGHLKGCFSCREGLYSGGASVFGAIRGGFGEFVRPLRCSTWNIPLELVHFEWAAVGALSLTWWRTQKRSRHNCIQAVFCRCVSGSKKWRRILNA